jgi:hypothetical protein
LFLYYNPLIIAHGKKLYITCAHFKAYGIQMYSEVPISQGCNYLKPNSCVCILSLLLPKDNNPKYEVLPKKLNLLKDLIIRKDDVHTGHVLEQCQFAC